MNPRLPRFNVSSKAFINSTVDIKEVGTGDIVIENLRCGIFPSSVIEDVNILGRYTNATMIMFCKANDEDGDKLDIQKEYVVEEIASPNRHWLVTDDPENYMNVYLLVPLRSHFSAS